MKRRADIKPSTGNVFKDLATASPEEDLAKAELTAKIAEIISSREMNQTEAAKVLGIDQPKVSALLRGRLAGFSIERLMKFLAALGSDVKIVVVKPRARGKGHFHVVSAREAGRTRG